MKAGHWYIILSSKNILYTKDIVWALKKLRGNKSYMGEGDFDTVTTIAAEREDIGIFMSSTPTGRRSKFYEACINKKMGYSEHYHPSMDNPNWGPEMEDEFRAQLSEQGYVHEILAEFGTQDTGVFNKDRLDEATKIECYSYNELDYYQRDRVERLSLRPNMYIYPEGKRAAINPFRTMGVDWDKGINHHTQVA